MSCQMLQISFVLYLLRGCGSANDASSIAGLGVTVTALAADVTLHGVFGCKNRKCYT